MKLLKEKWSQKRKLIVYLLFKIFSSAFFWFCNDERTKVKALNPEYGVGDIAKELGKKWSDVEPSIKSKYEAMAENDKKRYERVSCFSPFSSNINGNAGVNVSHETHKL